MGILIKGMDGWEEVLEVIGKVRGIGPKTLAAIDEKLRSEY